MLNLPTTVAEIDQLIRDGVQEDLHLDYKESPAIDRTKRNEIAKDISAFANSDGGILIYGIVESNNLPVSKDGGVDHGVYTREWLEQVISSNITPRIDNIQIVPIPLSASNSIYCVDVPKSYRAPHQAPIRNTTSDLTFNRFQWRTMK
jgi:predicted HTH transcriptional regulator